MGKELEIVELNGKYAIRRKQSLFKWEYLDIKEDYWWDAEYSLKYCFTSRKEIYDILFKYIKDNTQVYNLTIIGFA